MIAWLAAFSRRGCETAVKTADELSRGGWTCRVFAGEKHRISQEVETLTVSSAQWAEKGFREADALVFCCAAGIAVRAISPWVKSKTTDPAIVVVDEMGRFSISLMSGHLGGANELAEEIACGIGAIPVITTATDLHGLFAVDVFARKNDLHITDMAMAKKISAALLEGAKVGFFSDIPWRGSLPGELTGDSAELGIAVSAKPEEKPFRETLQLIPRRYAVGLGCRRDKAPGDMDRFFREQLLARGIRPEEVRCIASIDVKKDEGALLQLAQSLHIPFYTYTAEALNSLPGTFSGSDFVRRTVGVDCVCERAAVMAAGGKLIQKKIAGEGMTFAAAEIKEDLCFE